MVWILKGALDSTVSLVCPHCGFKQLRARKPTAAQYTCRKCYRRFTAAQAQNGAQAKSRAKARAVRKRR